MGRRVAVWPRTSANRLQINQDSAIARRPAARYDRLRCPLDRPTRIERTSSHLVGRFGIPRRAASNYETHVARAEREALAVEHPPQCHRVPRATRAHARCETF